MTADILVATAPVPQVLALLAAGNCRLPEEAAAKLSQVAYAPCLCLLLWVEGAVDLPEPGALQTPNSAISWIADNRRKGISPEATILTVHANPDVSAANYHLDDDSVRELLMAELAPRLDGVTVCEVQVKRWRFALPTQLYPARFLYTETPAPLFVGGDAFGGPRVEGAALSGLAIADALRKRLGNHQDRTVGEA